MDFTAGAGEDERVALTVSTRNAEGCAIVSVAGDVDISTSPDLREALATVVSGGSRAIVVDLAAVKFVDSTALGVLVGAYTAVRNTGGRLAVVNDHPAVLKVLQITALHDVLGVRATLADAMAALGQPQPAADH
jgi:anti-sigma B factor antagonist